MSAEQSDRLVGKKRAAEDQLTPDNYNQAPTDEPESNEPVVADAATLATRKIRRVKRPAGFEEKEDANPDSALGKAFAAATAGKPSSGFAQATSFGFGNTSASTEKKDDAEKPKTTFGFGTGTPAATEKKDSDAPVTFGFGNTSSTSTAEKKEESKPAFSFGFGASAAAASSEKKDDKPATTSFGFGAKSGEATGIVAAAAGGSSFGSVFSGGKSKTGESAAPANGFSFKVPEGCETPATEAPKPQVLPGASEVTLATGEEDEETKFTATAKLSERDGSSWAERGTGEMKLNAKKDGADLRLVMRDAATKRALLNCPMKNTFKIAKSDKNAMIFTHVSAEKTHTYLLKIPNTGACTGEKAMEEAKTLMEAALSKA